MSRGSVEPQCPSAAAADSTQASGPSDAELVVAARSGDRAAAQQLFRRFMGPLVSMANRLLPGDPELLDLVQDAYVTAFDKLEQLKEPGAFAGWLSAILVRRVRRHLRRRQMLTRLRLAHPVPIEEAQALAHSASPEVRVELMSVYAVLDKLRADERLALLLHRVEGKTVVEIAAQLGVSQPTARRRLRAAEVCLAGHLRRRGGEGLLDV